MKYKAIIWDMDGTLLNTLDDLTDCVNYALTKYGLPKRDISETRHFVGNGIGRMIRLSLPQDADEETYEKVFESFKEYYTDHCKIKTGPYPGVQQLLSRLKAEGFKMAIVSNKVDFALKALAKECFGDSIDVAIGEREGLRRKPEPDMVELAMKEIGAQKSETVYIGDSDVDLMTARNSGLDCINVLWGFRTKEELTACGATRFASDTDELFKMLTE